MKSNKALSILSLLAAFAVGGVHATEISYNTTTTVSEPLVLTEDTTITVASGKTVTYDATAVISGAFKLTKAGAGTLNLKAANTFSGGLDIAGGDVGVFRGDAVGTGKVTYTPTTGAGAPKLWFCESVTCTNAFVLPYFADCKFYTGALYVKGGCDAACTGPITVTTHSWIEALSTGVLRIKGGIGGSGKAYLAATGKIVIEETALDLKSGLQLLLARAGFTEIAVAGNRTVDALYFKENGGLRLCVDKAFDGTPGIKFEYDDRVDANGGRIDLNGHDGAFGNMTVNAGRYQAPLHVLNTSATPATFSLDQTSDCVRGNIDFDGSISFVKRGTATLTVTNETFAVPNMLHVSAGALVLNPTEGAKIADFIRVERGATLDLGGRNVTCRKFSNFGGTVRNGSVTADFTGFEAEAGETLTYRVDDKLSAYYPFSSAATLGRDASGNGNVDLLSMGSPEFKSEGKFGGGVYFDGTTALTNPPGVYFDSLPSGKTAFTVLAQVKSPGAYNTGRALISFGKEVTGQMMALQIPMATQIKNMVWGDKDVCQAVLPNGGSLSDGKWHAIGGSGDITNQVLWADGVCIKNVPTEATPNFAKSTFTIAGHLQYQSNYKGWADEVAVLRRCITAAEFAKYDQGGVAAMIRLTGQSLVSRTGATLNIAGGADIVNATGPGVITTYGAVISGTVKECPKFDGNVTLADGVTFDLTGLGDPSEAPVELLRVTNGTLTVAGKVNVIGAPSSARIRLYEKDGSYWIRYGKGLSLILR